MYPAELKPLTPCAGPRQQGEGVNDVQGILSAERTPTGGAKLRVSLLAAGFVIGPGGSSVRDIARVTSKHMCAFAAAFAGTLISLPAATPRHLP